MTCGWLASELGHRLRQDFCASGDFRSREARTTEALVRSILAARQRFGITRLGSLTRLGHAGICVAQAVRPLSLSNAVSQGKGIVPMDAAASALMESLETWAAEHVPAEQVTPARACDLGAAVRAHYAGCLVQGFDAGWDQLRLGWIDGADLFTGRTGPVPLALVDTVYTYPSPHPAMFPRSTTGLAAAPTLLGAIIHAALEVLERASVAAAERRPYSLCEQPVDSATISGRLSSAILARLRQAGLIAGIWLVAAEHDLPVFRCHVMDREDGPDIAALPGFGFGCDFTQDRALAKALLEAAQARVTAIAGTREDLTRLAYPERYDRAQLAAWRQELLATPGAVALARDRDEPVCGEAALYCVLRALARAGAKAAFIVPLFSGTDPAVEVVRMVAPPLRHAGRA